MGFFSQFKKSEDGSYFKHLSESYRLPQEPAEIYAALNEVGEWKSSEEWRISTWTDFKISKIEKDSEVWFKVEVKCDHEFTCYCPTVERAVQMANLYQAIILNMFYQLGWPSWISLTEYPGRRT